MSNLKTRFLKIAVPLSIAGGAAVVLACGPDFPLQLLDDRAGTLTSTPANSFAFEAAHLAQAADKLQASETGTNLDDSAPPATASASASGSASSLTKAQRDKVKAMRALGDGDAAYASGADLPAALRLYTAGAVDYLASRAPQPQSRLQQDQTQTLDSAPEDSNPRPPAKPDLALRAQLRFQALLDLPPADGSQRAVAAAYMLGQGHANAMSAAGADASAERAKAMRAYALARARAIAGAPDPSGLATASFGEQARLYLIDGNALCAYADLENATPCADGIKPADLKQAIQLYAEQAARGSNNAIQSLRSIAAWALSDSTRAARLIDDPLSQRLLVAYALARVGDIVNGDPASASDYFIASYNTPGYADVARGGKNVKPNPALQALTSALQSRGIDHISGIDRVAALAYRVGRYDLAQALVDKQHSALSSWVRAKLALRKGDMAGAAQAYAEASKAFPQADASLDPASATLLKGEQGVLTLSRGQYIEALDQLYAATSASRDNSGGLSDIYEDYAGDLLYVAERVVTTDELKNYIDAHLPATPAPPAPADFASSGKAYEWQAQHPRELSDHLRQLLARRLVREGRVSEALPYFPDDKDMRYVDMEQTDGKATPVTWRSRQLAQSYGDALHDANHSWWRATRAKAWYQAATLARQHGLEIMGYEQSPDFYEYGGEYAYGAGRADSGLSADASAESATDSAPNGAQAKHAKPDTPQKRAAADLPGPYVTDGERQRYAASEAKPNQRFHYRRISADYIMKAADELPPRSQAFAAVLCNGAGFVYYDEQSSSQLYRRYVRQGAAVPFSAAFGLNCEAPDFAAAARFPYVQAWKKTRHWIRDHRRTAALSGLLGLLGLLVLASALVSRRLRRRRAEKPQEK